MALFVSFFHSLVNKYLLRNYLCVPLTSLNTRNIVNKTNKVLTPSRSLQSRADIQMIKINIKLKRAINAVKTYKCLRDERVKKNQGVGNCRGQQDQGGLT